MAPEPVTKAVPLDDGTGKRARIAVVSKSSSSVSTTTTASRRSSAVAVAWSPASAPVCDCAASRARTLLPGISSTIGLPASRAWRASCRNSCGRRTCSTYIAITRVDVSAMKCASTSSTPITASLPVDTAAVSTWPRPMNASRRLAAIAPLCASTPTPGRPLLGYCDDRFERERNARREVRVAHAVGPEHRHAGRPRRIRDLLLLDAPFVAGFRIAGRVDDHAPHALLAARPHGLQHAGFGNRKHGYVDAVRQFGHRLHARAAVDFGAAAAHEMDGAGIAEALQVAQHETAERPRVGRRADDGDRGGLQEPGHGDRRETGGERCLHGPDSGIPKRIQQIPQRPNRSNLNTSLMTPS